MNDLLTKEYILKTEHQVLHAIAAGKTEDAIQLTLKLIIAHAQRRDFEKAEAFREKLYEIDAMAISEIVRAGEIIEEAQSASIDPTHLHLWQELYDTLTTEEANVLYYSMEETRLEADETVFNQGEKNQALFFINQGEARLAYTQESREVLLKNLESGDVAGGDTFFTDTICTTSVVTLSRLNVSKIEKSAIEKWREQAPGLESKVADFCLKKEKIHELLENKGLDRRTQHRVNISGKATNQLMQPSGKDIGKPFKSELSDISTGGLSFVLRITKKKTASLLLGRKLNVKFDLSLASDSWENQGENPLVDGSDRQCDQVEINQYGTIVAARPCPFGDYSFHVKFETQIEETVIKKIEDSLQ